MSVSCFANAVWGVVLSDREHNAINKLLKEHGEEAEASAEDPSDPWSLLQVILPQHAADLEQKLRDKYGAPEEACLVYTGPEDDRPGECNVDADVWILGIGYPNFPIRWPQRKKFKNARWHSWVEAG